MNDKSNSEAVGNSVVASPVKVSINLKIKSADKRIEVALLMTLLDLRNETNLT